MTRNGTVTSTINPGSRKNTSNSTRSGMWAGLLCLLVMMPMTALATHFEIANLAAQLDQVSGQLAHELKYDRGYGSVRLYAERLSREAAKLAEAIHRDRSSSYVKSQFSDVTRRYNKLEDAVFRANNGRHDVRLYNDLSLISNLYSNLSNQFYYSAYAQPAPRVYVYSGSRLGRRDLPPAFGWESYGGNGNSTFRDRDYRGRENGRRSYQGSGNRSLNSVIPGRSDRQNANRADRRDYGQARASRSLNSGHRSPVLERQYRNEANRYRVQNFRGSGGRSTETRRSNHYE